MSIESNVISAPAVTRQPIGVPASGGLLLGALGILGFSFSLPATKLAVETLDPWFVAFGRAVIAGMLATIVLAAAHAARPSRAQVRSLLIVALGVVVGFPLFTSLALQTRPAGQSAVVIAVLPAMTAVMAVLRAGERPSRAFWLASTAGLVAALAFAFTRGATGPQLPDLFLLLAVALCALGYAEGGMLARNLGGGRTICWALVLSLPVTVPVAAVTLPLDGGVGLVPWLGFGYVSLISMFLGFFAWYAGLARGGVARVGQIQLAQPLLSLVWAALVLSEAVGPADALVAAAVLACVVATQRAR
ncbi:MAG: DMT family transporter [Solirubrobacterales bacterium]|nr:DMT family transporter [Solirubrobacterales bacterium]